MKTPNEINKSIFETNEKTTYMLISYDELNLKLTWIFNAQKMTSIFKGNCNDKYDENEQLLIKL